MSLCESLSSRLAKLSLSIERVVVQRFLQQWFKRLPDNLDAFHPKHIVIFRVGNFGDTLLALPAIKTIRRTFPHAHITLITASGGEQFISAQDVLELFEPLIDSVCHYDPRTIRESTTLKNLTTNVLDQTPDSHVDLFIDLPVSMQTAKRNLQELLLAKILNADYAMGFGQIFPSIGKKIFSKQANASEQSPIPRTDQWLCNQLGHTALQFDSATAQTLSLNDSLPSLNNVLSQLNITQAESRPSLICINAGAKLDIKCWPEAYYSQTINKLDAMHPNTEFILIGSHSERDKAERIIASGDTNAIALHNACGVLSLKETAVLIQHSKLLISNDTGTVHLAGLLSTPTKAPYSGQFPKNLWHPAGSTNPHSVIRHDVPCAPCFYDTCPLDEQLCMTQLTPDRLLK